MASSHLLLVRSALAGCLLWGGGAGGAMGAAGLSAQSVANAAPVRRVERAGRAGPVRLDHAGRPLAPGARTAVAVPGFGPRAATDWLTTTHPNVSVLFSYERVEEECPVRCDLYRLWVRYASPGGGMPPSAEWRRLADADCADFWTDGARDFACATSTTMAGRDRRGNDYVLLQLYATRAQFERMLRSRTVRFQLGGVGFSLAGQGRTALGSFLASAGPAVPR